jgi:hypothetical protein
MHEAEARSMRASRQSWHGLVLGLALLGGGCDGQDPERLARVGRLSLHKLEDLAGGPQGKLASGWQAVLGSMGSTSIDSRVALRLRWDKLLADAEIQVQPLGAGVVRLQGAVANGTVRSRAQEVAETTQGVEKVDNALTVSEP